MPGDIDLWLPEGREKVTEVIKKEYPEAKALYMHIEVKPEKGVTLEIHNVPALMYNPFAFRKLRKMMNGWKDMATELELPDGAGKVLVPCDEMNRVYMLAHKFRHMFTEGIGLRQMMDYMMLLRKGFTEEEKDNTVIKLKELHLDVFCRAVMYVLTEYLGMEKKFCLMEPDKGAGERLLDIIIEGGNFGKFNVNSESYKKAVGVVARNLCYCQLLSGRKELSRNEALKYGKYFLKDKIGRLINMAKYSSFTWNLLVKFLQYREYNRQ